MARLHPGVYIEEVSSGVRPIEGVSTSTAAFVGKAELGDIGKAVLVTSLQEFQKKHGSFPSGGYLAHSVYQFFNNGGKSCYIVRIAGKGARAADIALKDRKGSPSKTLTIRASSEGAWGNALDIEIADGTLDSDNEFAVRVKRDRSAEKLPPLLLETFDNLSMDAAAGNYVKTVINANSMYVRVEVEDANLLTAGPGVSRSGALPSGNAAALLQLGAVNGGTETAGVDGPPATAGTSQSSASAATALPADKRKFLVNLDGDGDREIMVPLAAGTGAAIAAAIQDAVTALTANTPAKQPAYTGFICVYDDPAAPNAYLLSSGTTGAASSVVVMDSTATAISLPAGQHQFVIEVNGDGPHTVTLNGPLGDGDAIKAAILAEVQGLTPKRQANAGAFSGFDCQYDITTNPGNPSLVLTSGVPGVASTVRVIDAPADNVAGTLKLGLTNGGKEISGGAVLRPANSQVPTEYHLGDAVVTGNIAEPPTFGDDGGTPNDQDYINGLNALNTVRDVSILCIPGIGTKAVVDAGTNYCAQRADCFFIGDCNKTDDSVEDAQDFLNSLTVKSSYGAIYYPWLKMLDPTGVSPVPIAIPPSGFVAGMYARIDAKRGVWKAPAGTEANIGGAVGVTADTTDAQQDFLNPIGVNVIRTFPASGIVIWGTRTLATKSDPEYRYIPVRRTAIFLEQSIYNGIQWAVFEPNDEDLWASLRANINSFMMLQFRAGAFQGKTPSEAFFVKCDSQTTTQADIDAGTVNILVGFAALKPAEFVVLQLSQKAGQPAA
jgi:phage tail sheath protein FI